MLDSGDIQLKFKILCRFRRSIASADRVGALREDALPDDMAEGILVLTAGTTASGATDPLGLAGRALDARRRDMGGTAQARTARRRCR